MKVLDLDAVRAFVLVADLASFTRAADALGTTQSAVSLKLKRLEARLGKPLLARTPRVVKLAADGENFLPAARALLDAHDHALGAISAGTHRLSLGVSEHVAVPDLPAVLTSLHRQDPGLSLEMHLGMSANLLVQYDERRLDAAIVRHEPGEDPPRDDGTVLFTEPLAWLASPEVAPPGGESFTTLARRVRRGRDAVIAAHPGRTVVVVSHVSPIKTLLRLALDAPPVSMYRIHLDTASVSLIDYFADGNCSVRLMNDTGHLAGLPR